MCVCGWPYVERKFLFIALIKSFRSSWFRCRFSCCFKFLNASHAPGNLKSRCNRKIKVRRKFCCFVFWKKYDAWWKCGTTVASVECSAGCFSSACSSRMATDKPASIPSTDCSTADAVPSCSYPRFDEKEDEKCVISNFCLQA